MLWIRRLFLYTAFLALLITNILTLTNTTFNAALSGLMGTYLGVKTVSSTMQAKLASKNAALKKTKTASMNRKKAVKHFGSRLTSRTKRVVGKSIAAIPAESIPFLGVAVLIADTGYEIYAACESMQDLDELYLSLGFADAVPDDAMHSACNPNLPNPEAVWDDVLAKSNEWLDKARAAM